jgi:hypothetical protein
MYVYIYIYIYIYIHIHIYILFIQERTIYIHTHKMPTFEKFRDLIRNCTRQNVVLVCFSGHAVEGGELVCQGQRQHGDARAQICGTSYCTLHVQVRVRRQGQKAVPSNVSCSTDATPARSALS